MPLRETSRDTLHDDRASVDVESFAPRELPRGILPAGSLGVPFLALLLRGQAWSGAFDESGIRTTRGASAFGRSGRVRAHQVRQVGQRVADGAHLPVEDSDDAGLGLVEDDVVDLVVAVHKRRPVLGLRAGVLEEADHLVVVRDHSDGFVGVFVTGLRLAFRDGGEGLELAVVEAALSAELFEADAFGVDAVEFGESGYCAVPHVSSVFRSYVWEGWVFEDAAVEEGHDVESGANDGVIFAETVCLWDRHVGVLQSVQDAVLAVDLVGGL